MKKTNTKSRNIRKEKIPKQEEPKLFQLKIKVFILDQFKNSLCDIINTIVGLFSERMIQMKIYK